MIRHMNDIHTNTYIYVASSDTWEISNYTDIHDVDEDDRTMPAYGGYWEFIIFTGIMLRHMIDSPFHGAHIVASSNVKNWSNIIRIGTMSTKILSLARFMVECMSTPPREVLCIEICSMWTTFLLLGVLLLLHMCEHHLLTLDGYHNVGHKIPTDQLIHMYLYLYKFI